MNLVMFCYCYWFLGVSEDNFSFEIENNNFYTDDNDAVKAKTCPKILFKVELPTRQQPQVTRKNHLVIIYSQLRKTRKLLAKWMQKQNVKNILHRLKLRPTRDFWMKKKRKRNYSLKRKKLQ